MSLLSDTPDLTHQLLVETARPELGVSDKRYIQNVQGRGVGRFTLHKKNRQLNKPEFLYQCITVVVVLFAVRTSNNIRFGYQ